MIEINNLSKSFSISKKQQAELNTTANEVFAVNDISFTCKPGRIFSLLGPNGAGKTTTLRLISTLIKPTSGNLKVCGYDVIENPSEVRKQLGFLTGSTGLYQRLTPNEVIQYFANLYDVPKAEYKVRKEELFEKLQMNHFANKPIGQLSTGMKQKVSIVRTMIHNPNVVVFDEPTSGLDVVTSENIINLIQDCKTQGKTVIFSSHIMSEVDLLCDDLAIINNGKICYNNSMANFRANMQTENLTAEFIRIVKEN